MTSINDVNDNSEIITKNLNYICEYAKNNNINSITELKNVFSHKMIEACCRVVSVNCIKKRKRMEENKKTKNESNKKQKNLHFCYVCKKNMIDRDISHFCEDCSNINKSKRNIKAYLDDKIAVVTGGRIKIGFETAIRLLECNCTVIVTTRFIGDAINRFSKHPNYEKFKSKLVIYPLDLRNKTQIDKFCEFMYNNYSKLDILINNAAQTIRKPREFFEHLIENETKYSNSKLLKNQVDFSNDKLVLTNNTNTSLVLKNDYDLHIKQVFQALKTEDKSFFPEGQYDENEEQVDLRKTNTWIKQLGEIDMEECVECMAINALAPFHLNQCLKNLLKNANGSYIVNVSSMEGIFNMKNKTPNHPHTNMAKSALNMMTRTSAKTYVKDKIYMIGVDTGWVTNEYPNGYTSRLINYKDNVPLDNIDGACRILDPIFEYYNTKKIIYGVFLKDYVISEW